MPHIARLHFPGRHARGALNNIKDAIAGYIFSLEKHGEAVPL
jgi:hypothetical protein